MADLPNLSDLYAATEGSRIGFLRTDLELCFTFVDLAQTEREIGDRAAARRVLQKAEIGYATMVRMVAKVGHADQKNQIEQKLIELRTRLDRERHCLGFPSA
jgi:hypothetical protein